MERNAKDAKPNVVQKGATESLHVSYIPREDATWEGELAALAAVYQFVIDCALRRKAARGAKDGENAEGGGDENGTEVGLTGAPLQERPDKDGSA
jgi:hypothetical protein